MAQVNRPDGINNTLSSIYRQRTGNVQNRLQINRGDQTNGNVNGTGGLGPVDQFVPSANIGEVNRLKEQVDRLPDADEQKVARLREQINNGTYTIDTRQVAERILATGTNLNILA